jgi:hypothetical protein
MSGNPEKKNRKFFVIFLVDLTVKIVMFEERAWCIMKINYKNKKGWFYTSILIFLFGYIIWMITMPGHSYQQPMPELTSSQKELSQILKNHVISVASKAHNYQHLTELDKSAHYIESQLIADGYRINQQFFMDHKVHNIEVVLEPSGKVTSTVVIGAHYDSAGEAVGANDNATGVAVLLELGKRFKNNFHSEHTRLRIVFFVNEEPPYFKTSLMGSAKYARLLKTYNEPVIAMYAFDELGRYSDEDGSQKYPFFLKPFYPSKGNFIGFVGNIHSRPLVEKTIETFRDQAAFPSQGIAGLQYIPGIDFSDHLNFYIYGWQALMITDTAFNRYQYYHTPQDTVDKINFDRLAQLTDDLEKMFRTLHSF